MSAMSHEEEAALRAFEAELIQARTNLEPPPELAPERLRAMVSASLAAAPAGGEGAAPRPSARPAWGWPAMGAVAVAATLAVAWALRPEPAPAGRASPSRGPSEPEPPAGEAATPAAVPHAAPAPSTPPAPPAPPTPPAPATTPAPAAPPPPPTAAAPHHTRPRQTAAPTQTAAELLHRGNELRRAGKLTEARRTYRELRRRYPRSREGQIAAVHLGSLDLERGSLGSALRHFDAYLADPGAGNLREEAMWGKTRALGRLGRRDRERETLRALLEEFPASIYTSRARARLRELEPGR